MANLIRWDPFRDMVTLRSMMDRMLDNTFERDMTTWKPAEWGIALDVTENDDEFLVKASVPGITPDDLEITFTGDTLTIKGEVKEDKEVDEKQYHLRERRFGHFSRSISLPFPVTSDEITASYDAGVLTLHLPKTEEVKPKRIEVKPTMSQKVIEGSVGNIKNKN